MGPFVQKIGAVLITILAIKSFAVAAFLAANALYLAAIAAGIVIFWGVIELFNRDNSGVFFRVITVVLSLDRYQTLLPTAPGLSTWYCWSQ